MCGHGFTDGFCFKLGINGVLSIKVNYVLRFSTQAHSISLSSTCKIYLVSSDNNLNTIMVGLDNFKLPDLANFSRHRRIILSYLLCNPLISVNNFSMKILAQLQLHSWCVVGKKFFSFSSWVFKNQAYVLDHSVFRHGAGDVKPPSEHRLNVSARFCKSVSFYATKHCKMMVSASWLITCFGYNSICCEKILDVLCSYITDWFHLAKWCEKVLSSDIVLCFHIIDW